MAKQIFKEKKIFRAISEILKLQPCERKDVLISELRRAAEQIRHTCER